MQKRIYFNPRSHEGSDLCIFDFIVCKVNFNPRSHEGSDTLLFKRLYLSQISIHAPTKGATFTPAFRYACVTKISIHAPTKGATFNHLSSPCLRTDFNPRSHEGSDWISLEQSVSIWIFQSTLPRRERPFYNSG